MKSHKIIWLLTCLSLLQSYITTPQPGLPRWTERPRGLRPEGHPNCCNPTLRSTPGHLFGAVWHRRVAEKWWFIQQEYWWFHVVNMGKYMGKYVGKCMGNLWIIYGYGWCLGWWNSNIRKKTIFQTTNQVYSTMCRCSMYPYWMRCP